MLGGPQYAIGHGDQGDVFTDRLEVPDLILIESIDFAFFVIHFHRPAMPSDPSDAFGTPFQSIREIEGGRIRQVFLAVIDHQPLLPKVG